MERFAGVLAPVITPFDENLDPDPGRLARHCRWLLSQGAGLAVFGTNSEANSLSGEEKSALLGHLVDAGIPTGSLMPGTGTCSLTETVRLTAQACELGCRGVLMLPPFYYKGVSDEGLFTYYAEVIERVGSDALQVYLYHIPQVTQVPLSLALIERLVSRYPDTIAGIKDSSGDWNNTAALNDAGWPDFRVFCGSESFLLQNMQAGGAGCISATANVNPGPICRLYEALRSDPNSPTGEADQQALNRVREIFQAPPMIPALKAATAHFGGDAAWNRVRPPLTGLDEAARQQLFAALAEAAFTMPDL